MLILILLSSARVFRDNMPTVNHTARASEVAQYFPSFISASRHGCILSTGKNISCVCYIMTVVLIMLL